jgi:DNA invertase Pin-like site-specific DNA recombinase
MRTFVAYLRVSTTKQGIDGLGIAAQEQAIKAYNGNVIATFTEVESGKKKDRPELAKALEQCNLTGSTLIVAKLDRLSRDPDFLGTLMKSGTDFIACDMPEANKFMIRIMAALAEKEREMISERTKAALRAAKARGVKLGNPNLTTEGRQRGSSVGVQRMRDIADRNAERVLPSIQALQARGLNLRGIAAELNAMSVQTPRGKQWTAMAVKNALDRIQ